MLSEPSEWTKLLMIWLALLLVVWIGTTRSYLEWSIRTRNEMYYSVFRRKVNRRRARHAKSLARAWQCRARLLAFLTVTGVFGMILMGEYVK